MRELLPFVRRNSLIDRLIGGSLRHGREDRLHLIALLEDLRRVLHAPPQDMSETWMSPSMPSSISTTRRVGQVANGSRDPVSQVVFSARSSTDSLRRAEGERKASRLGVHVGDDGFDRVADVEELRGVL